MKHNVSCVINPPFDAPPSPASAAASSARCWWCARSVVECADLDALAGWRNGCRMAGDPIERRPVSGPDGFSIAVQGFADKARHRAAATRRMRRCFVVAITVVAAAIASAYGYSRYKFPYGWTHCCDKQIYLALRNYAELHKERFPSGQSTPEACLSLLHAEPIQASAYLLCGKTVDPEIAEQLFSEGRLLGPTTCDWHYVPGLSLRDDPQLALFWDKPGLGHNGERLSGGGHIVCFIHGDCRHIPASEWQSFLAEQNLLRHHAADSE